MRLGLTIRRLAAALAVTAVPLLAGGQPADASESYGDSAFLDHTAYKYPGEEPVTCEVWFGSYLYTVGEGEEWQVSVVTDANGGLGGGNEWCGHGLIRMTITYRDPEGVERTTQVQARGYVDLQFEASRGHVEVRHQIGWADCARNCVIRYRTSPK